MPAEGVLMALSGLHEHGGQICYLPKQQTSFGRANVLDHVPPYVNTKE